ncbi:uncharacterized protein P174DRAFT_290283 [Aspergillus novofumigatus IBT 16806]|uniref:Uncharacterized protein n=1 Tax=Aspergillus novofumigatus (strain IBT 16806) TaxID=1392255 RepID=A0A2I1BXS0_ASPN1|nr:uncharacterized protein P174DRAFT_290283 [Aspergillus novofumigatus IBT 16806]PKX90174.1 hypothetical protein P174DRAFT_290283 [Aspergillus novofumigatus IBT 16806]
MPRYGSAPSQSDPIYKKTLNGPMYIYIGVVNRDRNIPWSAKLATGRGKRSTALFRAYIICNITVVYVTVQRYTELFF